MKRRSPWITVLLVGLPVWLAVSAVIALWLYFRAEEAEEVKVQARFVQPISAPAIADDLKKFVEVIGERNTSSEAAAAALGRATSMIEGLLGPSNTGFRTRRERGPADVPLIYASVAGKSPNLPAVWVIAAYDSPEGSRGAEWNASGLAATLAAAQAFAGDQPRRTVQFLFLPHFNEAGGPVEASLEILRKLIASNGGASMVLAVEAMGGGEELWLAPDSSLPVEVPFPGRALAAEEAPLAGGESLAGSLTAIGLPALWVSTRKPLTAGASDDRPPFAGTVAMSAGALLDLIRLFASRD